MESFQPTQTFVYQRAPEKRSADYLYWKNLEFPITRKEHGAVTYIEFTPTVPYNLAVTSCAKVEVIDHQTVQTLKTFRHFRQNAYSGSFRADGRLLVAGGDEPLVQLFDVTPMKLELKRKFKGHTAAVHLARFASNGIQMFSGSDDKTVRLWDAATESELQCFSDHQDYIRCGIASVTSSDILVTGSYDHTVRLFDTRCNSSVLRIDHGSPVESVVMFPGGGIVASAGDNLIKIWDVLSGGRLLMALSSHHKTVTSLCFAMNYKRLVSASLDRHVKFHDVNTYQVVHSLDYPSAILSVAVSPDDSLVTVGMADGLLSMQRRKDDKQLVAEFEEKKRRKHAMKRRFKFATALYSYKASKEDSVVEHRRKQKLARYDRFFRRFEYSKALDAAMMLNVRTKSPEVTISVIQELIRRQALKSSLAGRDEKSVCTILKFLMKNLCDQRYVATVLDVVEMMLDLYEDHISSNRSLHDIFAQIRSTLTAEHELAVSALELMGTLDVIMSASTFVNDTDVS